MLDQITHLFRLQVIFEEGSLHRAAKRLHVSQPALSRSLSQLEQYYGRQLAERHQRGIRPTPFGDRVLSASQRLLRQWELTNTELRGGDKNPTIMLRVGAGPMWRGVLLPEIVSQMHKECPGVSFRVLRLNVQKMVSDLTEGRMDILLAGTSHGGARPGIVHKPLGTISHDVLGRSDHPALARRGKDGTVPNEVLLEYPWITFVEFDVHREFVQSPAEERIGKSPKIAMISDSLLTITETLLCSDCLCFLPESFTRGNRKPGLAVIPSTIQRRLIEVGMSTREELADWAAVRTFERICASVFAQKITS